jgi:hypothetical protein
MMTSDVIVMGVTIGTATGWEEVDVAFLSFYDFKPNMYFGHAIKGPYQEMYESIGINFQTGEVECYQGDEVVLKATMELDVSVH